MLTDEAALIAHLEKNFPEEVARARTALKSRKEGELNESTSQDC